MVSGLMTLSVFSSPLVMVGLTDFSASSIELYEPPFEALPVFFLDGEPEDGAPVEEEPEEVFAESSREPAPQHETASDSAAAAQAPKASSQAPVAPPVAPPPSDLATAEPAPTPNVQTRTEASSRAPVSDRRKEILAKLRRPVKASTAASVKPKRDRCGGPHKQIEKISKGHFRIDRDLVKYYLSSMERFNSLGYSRPNKEEGRRGWYISGFGCKSPVYKGGLRPRDVVQTVNGKKTNTVMQIFGLWASWKRHDKFKMTVLRGDKEVTLYYTLY